MIGEQIKLARQKKGISQRELATLLDVSIHTVSKYEQGQREPSLETITNIASTLGTSTAALLGLPTLNTKANIGLQYFCKDTPEDAKYMLNTIFNCNVDEVILNLINNNEYLYDMACLLPDAKKSSLARDVAEYLEFKLTKLIEGENNDFRK